ncbi:MAG: hypothetical protein A3J54_00485 [Candidatus Ryanbacteria bacterium RIFCSPHIGHO2_02_FULL_45_13b]|uniref:RNA polymerase sigma-70 region 2 domain-containing protein n=1 Tax=Candidatus Ryanbacteria bacterium RIFCSPHIGHO2_02_FULL_45_13b TaxID=1802117 RepID=A0A1G2G8R6_9BACT|nr:MAG: hypothetical protein A3J54_00485 [Candidatus Ryanbacteria bacterium RIFCSPHIGHO2_02_FULL_45_13b]
MMTKKQDVQQKAVLTLAYHDYAKGMNSYSFFKVHNHATSDDLVQDAFIKTWGYLTKGTKFNK